GAVAWWRRHPQRLAPGRVTDRAASPVEAPLPARAARPAEPGATPVKAMVHVVYASQTGFAEQLARQTAQALRDTGLAVCVDSLGALDVASLRAIGRALFVVSTTGDGDAPDDAAAFFQRCMAQPVDLAPMRYG